MAIPSIEDWRSNEEMLDYHATWHRIFRWGRRWPQSGQGEEFLYFHRQFIAWYTAERVARGLGLVPDWEPTQPISEGHTNVNGVIRPPNWRLPWSEQATYEVPSWFTQAGGSGKYTDPGPGDTASAPNDLYAKLAEFPDVDTLGKALEHPWHNTGHGAFGRIFARTGFGPGDMARTGTAPRDPFFFLWHRRIDNVWREWSELDEVALPPVDPVPVVVRDGGQEDGTNSPDVIISRTRVANAEVEFGNFDEEPPSDDVVFGQTAYLYARVENRSDQPVDARVHFFYAPVSLAQNRRYWVEIPPNNAGRWGMPVHLIPRQQKVVPSGPMPGAVVWESRFIAAPNVYRLLVALTPDDAPLGYPFERRLPPGGSVETLVKDNDWMAWRNFQIREEEV